jgi:hypothetical protein
MGFSTFLAWLTHIVVLRRGEEAVSSGALLFSMEDFGAVHGWGGIVDPLTGITDNQFRT